MNVDRPLSSVWLFSRAPRLVINLHATNTGVCFEQSFSCLKEQTETDFKSNPTKYTNNDFQIMFIGVITGRRNHAFELLQPKHIKSLKQLDGRHATTVYTLARRAENAYIAVFSRPDATHAVSILSHTTNYEKI